MAFFVLKGVTGAWYKGLNVTIPGCTGKPVEVDEAKAEMIRALEDPTIIEVDECGCPVEACEVKPKKESKPKPKKDPKVEAKAELESKGKESKPKKAPKKAEAEKDK